MGQPTGGKTITLVSITVAEYTPTTAIFPDTTLLTLKEGLTVIAAYDDESEKELEPDDYELSGDLTEGESVITVTYTEGGVTATAEFTVTVGPPHEHNWIKTSETAPTCSATGMEVWECANVTPPHHEDTPIPIDPDAHNYIWQETTPPTCEAAGVETEICAYNNSHTRGTRPGADAIGHDWGGWALNVPVDGKETRVCAHDNSHKETRSLLVFVEGGTFQLGKSLGAQNAYVDSTPVSDVTLSDFYIGRNEVTQGQWLAVMGRTQEQQQALKDPTDTRDYGRGNSYPVYFVSWYDAIEFCNEMSLLEGLTPYYSINKEQTDPNTTGDYDTLKWLVTPNGAANGYRLPTEAQWEYAAKGGNPLAPDWVGYSFAGSNNPNVVAQWGSDVEIELTTTTATVGTKAPNFLDLYDMTGNVMEWIWDRQATYTGEAKFDPAGPPSGAFGMLRGGSWGTMEARWIDLRSVARMPGVASSASFMAGFRLTRPAPGVGGIVPPVWRDGTAPALTAPAVIADSGSAITAQGWQISDDGENGWTLFTDTTAAMSRNGHYLRYYAVIGGTTYYSPNTVRITVISATARQVVIDMFDDDGDGWNGNGALRIVVNGTQLAASVKPFSRADTYTFYVDTGDVVELYWVQGTYQFENSFIAYYADTPPDPAFNFYDSGTWSGDNALVFRLSGYGANTLNSATDGTLLGSFTAP